MPIEILEQAIKRGLLLDKYTHPIGSRKKPGQIILDLPPRRSENSQKVNFRTNL